MDQSRLFHVAPDAIHLRLTYEALTGTWSLHLAVVEHQDDGESYTRPAETYQYMSAGEAYDVAVVGLENLLIGLASAGDGAAG